MESDDDFEPAFAAIAQSKCDGLIAFPDDVLLDLMGGVALLLWGLHMVQNGTMREAYPSRLHYGQYTRPMDKRKIVWRSVRPCPAWSRPELFLNEPQWRTRRTLWPGKVAFSNYALVLFAGTLDSIFELAPIVRKLFGHLVGSARHVTTYDGPEVYYLTDLEFM